MRLRSQDGFSLIELLLVMVLFIVILSATLSTFEGFTSNTKDSQDRLQAAEQARNGLDTMARQLRNLADREDNQFVIARLSSNDVIFQTRDPEAVWMRYCLDLSSGADAGRIWQGSFKPATATATDVPLTAGMTDAGSCPGSGWTRKQIVAENVVNQIDGRTTMPIFSFACAEQTAGCPAGPADYGKVTWFGAQAAVDTTPRTGPEEMTVSTGVFLRNQNQLPVASFTAENTGSGLTVFNGSESSDHEGRTLRYFWFRGTAPTDAAIRCGATTPTVTVSGTTTTQTLWGSNLMGTGVTLAYRWPSGAANPSQITLITCDPGDAFARADSMWSYTP